MYNAALYLDPRRKMMKWWADYLDDAERASRAIVIEAATPKKKPVEALGWFQSSW